MASGKPKATPESRLNYFRVCRITLDHAQQVLRNVFYDRLPFPWHDLPADGNWFLSNERWSSKLSQEMKSKILQGKSQLWDATILFHALLYSSHCLLANKIPGTKGGLETGSKIVKATAKSADFRKYVMNGSTIFFDLGRNFFRAQAATGRAIQPNDFFISKVFTDRSTNADVYVCSIEWQVLEELSHMRNKKFAHLNSCSTTNKDLNIFVQSLTKIYHQLKVPRRIIAEMQSMATEIISDEQVIDALQKYEKLLLEERAYWFEVRHELEEIHHDLSEVKVDVQELHEGQPKLISEMKSIQSDLTGVKTAVHENYQKISENLQTLDSQSHSIQEEVKQVEETLYAHNDKIEAASTTLKILGSRNDGLTQRISAQGKELRSQLQDVNSKVKEQTGAVQQSQLTLNVLKEKQTSTAARAGHQASKIQALEVRERETEKKIGSLQFEMEGITQTQEVLQHGVSDVSSQLVSVTRQLSSTIIDVEEVKCSLQTKGFEAELKMLEPSFFDAEVTYYGNKCHPGTRLWIINHINEWVLQSPNNNSRVYLITANAGMGKSVLAGKLCHNFSEKGNLVGCFFFQHNKVRRNNPISVIHTFAYFLSCNVPPFRSEFTKHISNLSTKALTSYTAAELFTLLILEPIGKLTSSDIKVFVIDALDECEHSCHSEMIKLIVREFTKLPSWISVIITSRADDTIRKLKLIRPRIHLDPQDQLNINDITCFLRSILADRVDTSSLDDAVSLLVKKSEGLFLYFHYSVQVLLERQVLTIAVLEELLPEGIDDYYSQNFHRLHAQLQRYYHPLLSALVAARSGLPTDIIPDLLQCSSQKCHEIIQALSVLFPISSNTVKLFHASVQDWITDPEEAEEHVVSMKMGHQSLAMYSKSKLLSLMGSCPTDDDILSDMLGQFVIRNAIYHVTAIQEYCVDVFHWLTDIQFLYYHILVNRGITDLLHDFNHAELILHLLPSSMKQSITDCEAFIRKHMEVLSDNPLLIFQLAVNEGDTFQHRINMAKVWKDPKNVFHRLKCLLIKKRPPRSSSGLITSISQPLSVNSCRISKDGTVVTTCGRMFEGGKLCLWKWKNEIDSPLEFDLGREVNCCDISPDQKLIACGGIRKIYDFSGATVDIIANDDYIPSRDCSLFSPKMDTLLCWDSISLPYFTNVIELWDLKSYSKVILDETKDEGTRALCACYSPDGSLVITGHAEGSLKVWDCHAGKLQKVFFLPDLYPHAKSSTKIGMQGVEIATDLSSSGLSFTVTLDSEIPTAAAFKSIIETSTKTTPNKIGPPSKRYTNIITSCIYSPNSHFILASKDLKLYMYDAKTYELIESKEVTVPEKYKSDYINTVCCSPDSQFVVVSTDWGTVCWWKYVSTPSSVSCQHFLFGGCIQEQGLGLCCTFDKDFHLLVGNTDELRLFDFQVLISSPQTVCDSQHGTYVSSCCATISSKQGAFITSGDGSICLWTSEDSRIIKKLNVQSGDFICLSPTEDMIAVYGSGPTIELRDSSSLECFKCLIPKSNTVKSNDSCYYCDISSRKIIACGYESGHILIFYGPSMDNSFVLEGHKGEVRWLCFSPDGLILISGDSEGIVIMWHLMENKGSVQCSSINFLERHRKCVQEIHFSPVWGKMSRVASCSFDSNVHLYHGSTGCLIHQISTIKPFCLCFSPDGETLFVGGNDGKSHLYDGFTGDYLVTLESHSEEVSCIAFTEIHGEQYLVTGSYDNSLRIWNPVTGECLTVMPLSNYVMFVKVCQKETLAVGTYGGHVDVISIHTY